MGRVQLDRANLGALSDIWARIQHVYGKLRTCYACIVVDTNMERTADTSRGCLVVVGEVRLDKQRGGDRERIFETDSLWSALTL